MRNHPDNSLDSLHLSILPLHVTLERITLLTRRLTVVFEGFVRREGRVYVAADKVWEQHLLSNSSIRFRP